MFIVTYTTARGRTETATFSTIAGRDLFTGWLAGEGLGFKVEEVA